MRLWMEWMAVALLFAGLIASIYGWLPQVICIAMVAPGAVLSGISQWRNR